MALKCYIYEYLPEYICAANIPGVLTSQKKVLELKLQIVESQYVGPENRASLVCLYMSGPGS